MRIRRRVVALVATLGIVGFATLGSVAAQTVQEIKSRGVINIGTLVDYPPFGLLDSSGEAVGYDPDLARKFADQLGVKLNLVPVTSANRIQYLLSGQVDALFATLGITAERLKVVDFSQPYAGLEQFVYGDKSIAITDAAGLAGRTIGVTRGNTQDIAVTAVAPPSTTIQRYDDDASSTQALLSGQVPLLGIADLAIEQVEKAAPGRFTKKFSLLRQRQGIVVRKGSTELLMAINSFLTKEKQDGDLNKEYEKWMKVPLPDFIVQATQ
jgi:polar amino acid transport system substrate-binding protein